MESLSLKIMLQSLGQVGTTVLAIALATILLETVLYFVFVKTLKHKYAQPIMLLAPAVVGLTLLVIYPIVYEVSLAFSNMSQSNFKRSYSLTDEAFTKLSDANVSAETLAKFKGITDQEFSSDTELLEGLEKVLGQDTVSQHQDVFIEHAQRKGDIIKISTLSLRKLRKKIPQDVLDTLKEQKGIVNKIYHSEDEFLSDVEKNIGKSQLDQYRTKFLELALFNSGPTFGLAQGVKNFKEIFTAPVLKQVHFFPVFGRTMLWTFIQVTCHVVFGLGLAMLMNRPMKLRGLYRMLIIVPWAIPQVIAVLAWRGEFHSEYGFFNIVLNTLGFAGIAWKTSPFWNYVAMNMVNIWLGVPFMMVILLGGLQSIPLTFYEAADVDGATKFDKFRHITLPLMQPVMTPAIVLGVIWTFNNFAVPFLINDYELETSDILVTALFRAAFEYSRYGFAAAFALVIFGILMAFVLIYMRIVKLDLGLGGQKKKA